MAKDETHDPEQPAIGIGAFEGDDVRTGLSRAAQYLGMSAYAFGGGDLASAVQEDGDFLGIPHVEEAAGREFDAWRNQEALDTITAFAAGDHAAGAGRKLLQPDTAVKQALWSEINVSHQATTLLALLNLGQRSEEQVEAVAAAACLAAFSDNLLDYSNQVLDAALTSDDPLVRAIAASARNVSVEKQGPDTNSAPIALAPGSVSTAIHGTWGLVGEDPWYRPGSELYEHLRNAATPTLYEGNDYYAWSGEYSDYAREAAARDLAQWRSRSTELPWLDTVYAHSHGGNVALNAAAAGEPIKMLVLLHTPANYRSDDEWETIRRNVGGVVIMRSRFDLVVLADSLRARENRLKFSPSKLPHFPIVMHWNTKDAWFTHSRFVTLDTWQRYDLANIVRSRYSYIGERVPSPVTPATTRSN